MLCCAARNFAGSSMEGCSMDEVMMWLRGSEPASAAGLVV